jgi:hypothetical protein
MSELSSQNARAESEHRQAEADKACGIGGLGLARPAQEAERAGDCLTVDQHRRGNAEEHPPTSAWGVAKQAAGNRLPRARLGLL